MAISNERTHGILNRLIKFALKLQKKPENIQSSSSVHSFSYRLPHSFTHAVDNARIQAGYDILPQFHQLSIRPSSNIKRSLSSPFQHSKESHRQNHHKTRRLHTQSSLQANDEKAVFKKVRFQLEPMIQKHHTTNGHQKKTALSAMANFPKKSNLVVTISI